MTGKVTELKLTEQQLYLEYSLMYGVAIKDRVIRITDEIDQFTVDVVDTALMEMQRDSRKGITVKISSPGGDTYAALAIVDMLRDSKCHIHTIGYGHVFSAATLILACGDRRSIGRRAFVMHHEASFDVGGRYSDVAEYVHQVQREEEMWAQSMYDFTQYETPKFWLDQAKKRDWYLDAQEAVDHGIVEDIIG